MRAVLVAMSASVMLSACAGYSDRQSLGYGDYLGYSCDQLGEEALRLMRVAANRSEHLISDDKARRDNAMSQLAAVKRATASKRC